MSVMPTGKLPVVFISHGAPTLAIEDGEAHRFLRSYGQRLGRPRAILVLSAHFVAPVATVTAARSPETIHDFGGFSPSLYEMTYPAPGNPGFAMEIVDRLSAAGVTATASPTRGIDHGAWIPLMLMYPDADIPLVQVSLDPRQGPAAQYGLGRLLAPLRQEGVLIIASGGVTHNLGRLAWDGQVNEPPDWAVAFNEWVADAISENRTDDLLAYRERGPHAAMNHPTEEHFFPLLAALGAASGEDYRKRVHHSYTYGALSMDAYQFGEISSDPEFKSHGS